MTDERAGEKTMLEHWTRPDSYFGASWTGYYVFLGRNRDSDDLTESNFFIGLDRLGGESDTICVVRESHWACGWIEWIAIHESDSKARKIAEEILDDLDVDPVLDYDDFARREQETADQIWRDCYDWRDRITYIRDHREQFEFHNWCEMRECVRGEYFAGYASELI